MNVELPDWASVLWERRRYIALHGGRGAAKSRSVARALVIQSAQEHRRILCGREVQKSIKDSVHRLVSDEINRCGLAAQFTITESEIRGPNDSLFLFSGIRGNADAIKSIEGVTDFWGEEAQTFSQASLDTIIPTIRAPNSRLLFTWNPRLAKDPVDAMFRGNHDHGGKWSDPPDSRVMEVNYWDNPWFPEPLRLEMEWMKARDYEKYLHVWEGKYQQSSEARVFRNWRVEEFDTPDNVEFRLGADFGYSIDPSCLVRCWIDGTNLYVDYEAWGLQVEINHLPALFMGVPGAEKWFITADSSRPETISYLRNHGLPRIRGAVKGARSVEEGVEFLKAFDIIVHPRCQHLIDELTSYSYKTDSITGEVLPALEDKDNHVIDALRYACEGARRAKAGAKTISISLSSTASAFARR